MMKKVLMIVVIVYMMCLLSPGILSAGESSQTFKLSFSERFRLVGWDNSIGLSDDSSDTRAFTRHRTSIMGQWFPHKDIELALKLTNEFRYYLSPKDREFNFHEVIFDQLYVKWKNPGKLPLTLTLGRQNIILGEGFVVMDGNPLDGSRSIYFNAARLDYQLNQNHRLTAFYINQPETDTLLPVINDRDQWLIEQPEQGLGLYYSGKLKKTGIEAYIIRKDIEETGNRPVSSGINTLGARVGHPLGAKLSFTVEGAYQWGTYQVYSHPASDQRGMGGYFHLDYRVADNIPLFRQLTFGGIYLSGDDPGTEEREGWDPLFSRWPKWSESYIYTQINERGVAYWTNLNSLYVSFLMDVTKPMKLRLTWHHLTANKIDIDSFPGGTGKTRGDLIIGRLDFRVNKYTTGHFVWEYFDPGDFYFAGADAAHWLRFELMFKI
jgi:hypothetical protein